MKTHQKKQPDFPPNFEEACWIRYQKFMNNSDIPQGKSIGMLILVFFTYFLGLLLTMITLSGNENIDKKISWKIYHRPKNLIAVVTLIFFGYLVIEYGSVAIPYIQYLNIQSDVESDDYRGQSGVVEGDETPIRNVMGAANEENTAGLRLCIEKDDGRSKFTVSNRIQMVIFFIFGVIWIVLYSMWLYKMIIMVNPDLSSGLDGSSRQYIADRLQELTMSAQKAQQADNLNAFGRRRRKW